MKIFVLGAGRMGAAIIHDLSNTAGSDLELGIGDVDLTRAQNLLDSMSSENGRAYKVDVADSVLLASILRNYDSVVNATWYENNLHVMKACFKSGCNYNDLGGLFHMTRKQLLLDDEAKKSGVSAVVGGGESPGITNLMCAFAAREMTMVESVKIYAGAREVSESEDLIFPFSISTVLDEYTKSPVEYLDGKYVEVPALSGEEEVNFAPLVGLNKCHYSIHSEPATLPITIGKGVKNVEFRLGISEKMVRTLKPLIELGLLSNAKEIPFGGKIVSPREFMIAFFNSRSNTGEQPERWVALKTVVTGTSKEGNRCKSNCDLVTAPNTGGFKNATAYLTGVAGSIFGQYLALRKIPPGVIPPEVAINPQSFMEELKKRGINITSRMDYT
jgi:saccharopine dehydrogenase-like NADP-dependent oxidoreductase